MYLRLYPQSSIGGQTRVAEVYRYMWKQFVKDYLSFTRKERRAVIVLLLLIGVICFAPFWWPGPANTTHSPQEIAEWKRQVSQLYNDSATAHADNDYPAPKHFDNKESAVTTSAELFYFDPNTLSETGWSKLGVADKTIRTIKNYLAKGGRFRKPEDIEKIYGLTAVAKARLQPYVQIQNDASERKYEQEFIKPRPDSNTVYRAHKAVDINIPDINTADTAAFIALPGIGSKLASRIVLFRDKLGGFYKVEQVAETYGLPDSTFRKIKHLLQCTNSPVRQLNINDADANTLRQHPYIGWQLANVIVQYRQQHGNFKTVEELLKIDIITPGLLQKLAPYLGIK